MYVCIRLSDQFSFPAAHTAGTVTCSHVNKVRSEHIFIPLVPRQTDEEKGSLLSFFLTSFPRTS